MALAQSGWGATGVDFSAIAIRIGRRRLARAGVRARLLAADVTKPLLLTETYDFALDIGCFHTLPDRRGYLRNLEQLLRGGGHWLIYGFLVEPRAVGAIGLTAHDIEAVSSWGFRLLQRTDGTDHNRASAWLLFQKIPANCPEHASAAAQA
jgi:SAM-dependent methyltransferase